MTLAVSAALGLVTGSCAIAHVPVPPNEATTEVVVQAYADAVHARDCTTAAALVSDKAQSWCGTIDITGMTVTETTQERRQTATGEGHLIERVWVRFTLRGGDVSLPDGDHVWSYLLDRTGPRGAWRIYGQGLG